MSEARARVIPALGQVYVAKRSRSGRRWSVDTIDHGRRRVSLRPLGDDVGHARNARTGKWQGGVRWIWVDFDALAQRWERACDDGRAGG